MKMKMFLVAACMCATGTLSAKVVMPGVLSSNMVLQQQTDVRIWGKAMPGSKVVVRPSWTKARAECKAASDSTWEVKLTTPEGSYDSHSLRISDGDGAVVLSDVLVGEVWLASGQSNMEMPLRGFYDCPVEGSSEVIIHSGEYSDRIRFVKIPTTQSLTPREDVKCRWVKSSPETSPAFSAAAYFFAENLTRVLNVPVGIIDCNWGGSPVEAWMSREVLEKNYPEVNLGKDAIAKRIESGRPMVMYNAMLHPMRNYTLKGFLWYQGEANIYQHDTYARRMADMVSLWRSDWGLGDLPFYYVEIAPFHYGEDLAPLLREAQYDAQKLIPNSGMVSTNDLVFDYERVNIHPAQKRAVGQRLSYFALAETYKMKGVECRGPEFSSVEFKDGKAVVKFDNAVYGFNRGIDIKGFEICGADGVYYPALVKPVPWGRSVTVESDKVPNPVAVRYAFHDFSPGNLAGVNGLPVVPFRSDRKQHR